MNWNYFEHFEIIVNDFEKLLYVYHRQSKHELFRDALNELE